MSVITWSESYGLCASDVLAAGVIQAQGAGHRDI